MLLAAVWQQGRSPWRFHCNCWKPAFAVVPHSIVFLADGYSFCQSREISCFHVWCSSNLARDLAPVLPAMPRSRIPHCLSSPSCLVARLFRARYGPRAFVAAAMMFSTLMVSPVDAAIDPVEKAALEALKNALTEGGTISWTPPYDNWGSTADPCAVGSSWSGVTCDATRTYVT